MARRKQDDSAGRSKLPEGAGALDLAVVGEQVVELDIVERASDSTIGRVLKETFSSPSPAVLGILLKANSAFVAAMEDVLAVYTRPRDRHCPLVCLDETSKQLLAETGVAIPMRPGRPVRCDYEYERNGTANLFMLFAPLEGWRRVKVTDRHTAVDYAHVLKDFADDHFADASKIVLVQDNLTCNARPRSSEAFPAAEARRLVERFEWHFTPKHGSWLDLAELDGVLSSQCLDRRIPDKQTLIDEITAGTAYAMPITPWLIGTSQPETPASNSSTFTLQSE